MVGGGEKVVAIIQARISSKRLPAKVMKDLCGKTLLERVIDKVKGATQVDEIWVATSSDESDDVLELKCIDLGVKIYRGSLADVLSRFCGVVQTTDAEIILRVTGDNPLTETLFIDEGIKVLREEQLDYLYFHGIPYGSGVEVIRRAALLRANELAVDQDEREHVTLYIRNNCRQYKVKALVPPEKLNRPDLRVTIDTMEDYLKIYKIIWHFNNVLKVSPTLDKVITYMDERGLE